MSAIFSKPKMPKMPEMPKPVDTSGAESAAAAARLRKRKAAGRASTMLTGGQMTQGATGTTQLLGR